VLPQFPYFWYSLRVMFSLAAKRMTVLSPKPTTSTTTKSTI